MSFIMALGADCHQPQAQCARAHASKRLMNPWSGAQAPRDESPQESTMLSTVRLWRLNRWLGRLTGLSVRLLRPLRPRTMDHRLCRHFGSWLQRLKAPKDGADREVRSRLTDASCAHSRLWNWSRSVAAKPPGRQRRLGKTFGWVPEALAPKALERIEENLRGERKP